MSKLETTAYLCAVTAIVILGLAFYAKHLIRTEASPELRGKRFMRAFYSIGVVALLILAARILILKIG
jgi:hypothetical protein